MAATNILIVKNNLYLLNEEIQVYSLRFKART